MILLILGIVTILLFVILLYAKAVTLILKEEKEKELEEWNNIKNDFKNKQYE